VEFQLDGEALGEATSPPYQMSLPNTPGYTTGVHQIRARARDAAGNRSAWAVSRVTFGGNVNQPAGFTRTTFVQGLGTTGTAMAFAPDGRLFICEQGGDLRVVKNGSLVSTPFVHVATTANGERGLLGVAFHPNFAVNGYVYLYYTTSVPNNRISRFTAVGDVAMAGSELPIVELPNLSSATNHNGGAIHFGPDGKLYVAVGDNANGSNSQSTATRLGKILRYNDDGTIPSDNPTLGTGPNQAIWAMGLRNPFTFGFQSGTGRLFINDVGQNTWEEINEGMAGANYGWPTTEGATTNPAFTGPLFTYQHSANPTLVVGFAIVGSAFYNPATVLFPPGYVGNYFFADYVNQWVNRLDLAAGNSAVYAFARLPGSVTDLAVGADGALYALGVQGNGTWGVWRFSH
jgi:glucose/arabinose dehydrogenase